MCRCVAPQGPGEAVLDDKRFKQLDELLNQTTLYSKFLTEQMDSMAEARRTPHAPACPALRLRRTSRAAPRASADVARGRRRSWATARAARGPASLRRAVAASAARRAPRPAPRKPSWTPRRAARPRSCCRCSWARCATTRRVAPQLREAARARGWSPFAASRADAKPAARAAAQGRALDDLTLPERPQRHPGGPDGARTAAAEPACGYRLRFASALVAHYRHD